MTYRKSMICALKWKAMIVKAAGSIVLCKQTSCGRKLSVQRQTKVKIHMSYVITFGIWEVCNMSNYHNYYKMIIIYDVWKVGTMSY